MIGGIMSKGWCETTIPPGTSDVTPHPPPVSRSANKYQNQILTAFVK